ncbi:MAG: MFS transporter [Myxococcales bacterium]
MTQNNEGSHPGVGLAALVRLVCGQVFLHASMAGLRMAVPLQTLRADGRELALGPLLAAFAAAGLLVSIPGGRLVDRRGYHLPLYLAVASTSLGASVVLLSTYAVTQRLALLLVGALLSGGGSSLGLIAIQRHAGRDARNGTELKRVFSWLGVAPPLSNFVGATLTGILIDYAGFRAAFVVLALFPLGSLLSSRFVPREIPRASPATKPKPAWDLLEGAPMRRLLLVSWFMSASWDLHTFMVPVLGNERGLSASAIGAILGTFACAVTMTRFVLPFFAHRLTEVAMLRVALTVVACTFAIYPLAGTSWGMVGCAVCLAFALGTSQPMVLSSLHHITPRERQGEALGLRAMTSNTSSTLLPLVFGAAGTVLGATLLFWSMSALACVVSVIARSLRETPAGSFAEPPG